MAKKKHAAFGATRCGCLARYSVTRLNAEFAGSDVIVVRLYEDKHSHTTDTIARHFSAALMRRIDAKWRDYKHSLNFAALAEKLAEDVLEAHAAATGRDVEELRTAWLGFPDEPGRRCRRETSW